MTAPLRLEYVRVDELDLLATLRPRSVKDVIAAMPDFEPLLTPVDPPVGSYSPAYRRETGIDWRAWHREESIRTFHGLGWGAIFTGLIVFILAAIVAVILAAPYVWSWLLTGAF